VVLLIWTLRRMLLPGDTRPTTYKRAMGSSAGPPGTPTRRIPMAPGPAEDWSGIAASALLAGRMIPASSNMATRQPRMVFTLAPGQATE
jgi:hypothetical protein